MTSPSPFGSAAPARDLLGEGPGTMSVGGAQASAAATSPGVALDGQSIVAPSEVGVEVNPGLGTSGTWS